MHLREIFDAAFVSMHTPKQKMARVERTAIPYVALLDWRRPSAAVLAHRANIDASRRGEGPFYTAPKERA